MSERSEEAARKFLQPAPLRPSLATRMLLVIGRPGRSPKRLRRPNLLAYCYTGFKDKTWIQNRVGFQPCLPQRGPYEASEGIYPVTGNKNWGGRAVHPYCQSFNSSGTLCQFRISHELRNLNAARSTFVVDML